VYTHKIIVKC